MTAARTEILARIRSALADVAESERSEDVVIPRDYLVRETESTLERFVERVRDYGATVQIVAPHEVGEAVGDACRRFGVSRLAVPLDVAPAWIPEEVEAVADAGLDAAELDAIGAALTGCALGIAETGTIVLDGGPHQGRRALTLVPDVHICVIAADQVADGVPSAMRSLAVTVRKDRRPLTFVSGPSATSDIEFSRVEGVHGPRRFALVVSRIGGATAFE